MSAATGIEKFLTDFRAHNSEASDHVEELFRDDHPASIEASDAIRDVMQRNLSSTERVRRLKLIVQKFADAFNTEH